jgi:hypothetical protein
MPGPRVPVVEAKVLGLVESALERTARNDVGEIDKRARWAGDDDAVAANALALEGRLVNDHAPALPLSGRGHVNPLSSILEHPPQNGSTEVAKRGLFPAREHSSHELPVTRE